MKWCSKCNCDYEEKEDKCSVCGEQLVDAKYKGIKNCFNFLILVGEFILLSLCIIVPALLVLVGLLASSLQESISESLSVTSILTNFYTAPFIESYNIPTYAIVLVFLFILAVGIIGNLIINKKIKNIKEIK